MKIAILGFGNVGQGLAKILTGKRQFLKEKFGFEYAVVGVYDINMGGICAPEGEIDLARLLDVIQGGGLISDYKGAEDDLNALGLIEKCGADVLVELTYTDLETGEPAVTHCRQALGRGMHVVTSNKGPAMLAGKEMQQLAAENGVRFCFEGTVMSGTPTIGFIMRCLAGNDINGFKGILNGTSNFMLTRMEEGMTYEAALKEAQELGYAEADPTADVGGWDAAAKGVILANTFMGTDLSLKDIPVTGITGLKPEHIVEAQAEKKRWKLCVDCDMDGEKVDLKIEPMKLDLIDPLASVGGATNAITFKTDLMGPITIVGAGAGRVETGFSILSDLLWIHSE